MKQTLLLLLDAIPLIAESASARRVVLNQVHVMAMGTACLVCFQPGMKLPYLSA